MSSRRLLRGPFLKGYGPALALALAVAVMVLVVPSKSRTTAAAPPPAAVTGRAAPPTGLPVTGDVTPCPGRDQQITGDPYSPRCVAFTGDNGGATAPGVTRDTITVSYRDTPDGNYISLIQQLLHGDNPNFKADTPADLKRTVTGLVDYVNRHFQFYGRKIKLVPFQARGSAVAELTGAGQDGATADAVKASTSLHAFADLTALTTPYADALTKRGVMAFGAAYVSDSWFTARRPYAWSMTPSCSFVSKAISEFQVVEIVGKPAAYAGPGLKGKPRKLAIIAPDNPEYQRCVTEGLKALGPAGRDVLRLSYTLNFATIQNEAASLVSKLKAEGITSVGCACDTTMPIYLTKKASQQHYFPEWGVQGTALIDSDGAGQLYDQTQWAHASGISALGDQLAFDVSPGVVAYRSVRHDRPATISQTLYAQVYELALGIQMAGPNLTPTSFEAGLFAYPEHDGSDGTWRWGPGKYTPQVDVQAIWWDPERRAAFNGQPGSYVPAGPRYRQGTLAKLPPLKLFGP